MQMNDQNKLTTQTKKRAKRLNELTNELAAVSLFDSNLFSFFLFLSLSVSFFGLRTLNLQLASAITKEVLRTPNSLFKQSI